MESNGAFARFARLFDELDGSLQHQRHDVTQACVEALFDRVMNPPTLEAEDPAPEDVDCAVQIVMTLVELQAARVREIIAEIVLLPGGTDCR